jgi:hypothetical protein
MPLRFRDRTRTELPAELADAIPPPGCDEEQVMVADNPPPIRDRSYHHQPVQSLIVPLAEGGDRWHHALAEMQAVLDDWHLPPSLARRWLTAARPALAVEDVVELYIELDPTAHLISIEIWNDHGERVFGVDDYLPGVEGLASA